MAIRRLSHSTERTRPEDQIVDLMIAAEALFLAGDTQTTEIGYRLSLRAAYFTPSEQWDRMEVRRLFRTAYDARSAVAHGGSVQDNWALPNGEEVDLYNLDLVIEAHLRSALHKALTQCSKTGKRFHVDWEAELLA
jgi:hypothetical protein